MKTLIGSLCLLISGCVQCKPFEGAPEWVCVSSDVVIREAQPFELRAIITEEGSENASCTVSVDGGTVTLTVDTNVCTGRVYGPGKPYVPKTTVPCAVPALAAGSYTVPTLGSSTVVNVGGDAGVELCP